MNEILDYLNKIPNIEERTISGIINPLQTKEKALTMLNYLKETKTTYTSNILCKALELYDE